MPKNIAEIRKKPGLSNAYKYKGLRADQFAGPHKTYPINTLKRARNALSRAHERGSAAGAASIRRKVVKAYPNLRNPTGYTPGGRKKR